MSRTPTCEIRIIGLYFADVAMQDAFILDLPELPVRFMNTDHTHARELLERMVELASNPDAVATDLGLTCRAFLEHNRAHFGREEAAMLATGFPPYAVHKAEHGNALAWLADLASQAESSPTSASLRQAISRELPDWYLRHIQTMDTVTANWIAAHSVD
jgi:hemerythrin